MYLSIEQSNNVFHLSGIINEFANFDLLYQFSGAEMVLNWKNVSRINSTGVREWINALEKINEKAKVIFEECPIIVVYQMNMIPNFTAKAEVRSVYAPYFCEECGNQEDHLIDMESFDPEEDLPEFACQECGEELLFDDEEDSYFYFLDMERK